MTWNKAERDSGRLTDHPTLRQAAAQCALLHGKNYEVSRLGEYCSLCVGH